MAGLLTFATCSAAFSVALAGMGFDDTTNAMPYLVFNGLAPTTADAEDA